MYLHKRTVESGRNFEVAGKRNFTMKLKCEVSKLTIPKLQEICSQCEKIIQV